MTIRYNFDVNIGGGPERITQDQLCHYATSIGLEGLAPGRYSWYFVLNMYLYEQIYDVDPRMIIEEIKILERGIQPSNGTKSATQFKKMPLQGLWHKHFFSGHFVAQNILNELAGGRLLAIMEEICGPMGSTTITDEMIKEMAHRIGHVQIKNRDESCRLTGEWIIFAKHNNQNYYLCVSTHSAHPSDDQSIYDQIKSICYLQFPFLE